jgi:molybdate transport system ATP-binding protein
MITYIPAHAMHNFLGGYTDLYYQQRYYTIGDERIPLVADILGDELENLHALDIPSSLSIDHLLKLEVSRLSNGQLKKLLLLRNFSKGIPKLILLDYPFEGLDVQSREDLCQFIDFLHRRHKVQVIITDHHHHLPTCINRRLILDNFQTKKTESFVPFVLESKNIASQNDASHQHTNPTEIIRIDNLELKYGDHVLFRNFNWIVCRGERWALIGRNGAGKTTLFSMIFADHPQAYAQKIYLFGNRRGSGESIWDIKRRINYLGPEQISYLNPGNISITARDYLKSINQKLNESILDDLLQFFQADIFIDKQVRVLSSGELQLMMIMNCFLSDKELWLLDEPFQFLDDVQKENVSRYLRLHLKEDITLILITHYNHDLVEWTDRKMQL